MGGKTSRTKGHSFERWTAIQLRPFFPKAIRALEYQEGLGIDLLHTGRLRIQCKAYKKYAPLSKIEEAGDTDIPVLITKGDRKPPLICMRLEHFLDILHDPEAIHKEITRGDIREDQKSCEESDCDNTD